MTKSHKMTFVALAAMAVALTLAVVPALTSAAFADVSGTTNTGCTNGNNRPPGQQPTCQGEGLTQETCKSTTGNGKCPKGQNK